MLKGALAPWIEREDNSFSAAAAGGGARKRIFVFRFFSFMFIHASISSYGEQVNLPNTAKQTPNTQPSTQPSTRLRTCVASDQASRDEAVARYATHS